MAVIPAVPGLAVQIVSEGQACPEFHEVDDSSSSELSGNNVAVNYLQMNQNSLFEIHIQIGPDFLHHNNDLTLEVYLGGVHLHSGLYEKRVHFGKTRSSELVLRGAHETIRGQSYLKRYKFHAITTGKSHHSRASFSSLQNNCSHHSLIQ
jgi:hypothetical protein